MGEGATSAQGCEHRRASRRRAAELRRLRRPGMLLALAPRRRGGVPPAEPVLRAGGEGGLRGRAVFETLRVYDGRPFELHPHFDRLIESARKLRLPPPPLAGFQSLAHDALAAAAVPNCVLRFL